MTIDPERLYAASAACKLIPSPYTGQGLSLAAFHRRRRAGQIQAIELPAGRRRNWYVWGSEILRYLQAHTRREWLGQIVAPAQRRRQSATIRKELRQRGLKLKNAGASGNEL